MGVAIFAGRWDIGPGNVPAIPKVVVREVRDLGKTGRGQGMVREVRDLGRTGRGQGMGKGVMVKVLGTKVHVSTAIKLDIKQQSARMRELLRLLRLGQESIGW